MESNEGRLDNILSSNKLVRWLRNTGKPASPSHSLRFYISNGITSFSYGHLGNLLKKNFSHSLNAKCKTLPKSHLMMKIWSLLIMNSYYCTEEAVREKDKKQFRYCSCSSDVFCTTMPVSPSNPVAQQSSFQWCLFAPIRSLRSHYDSTAARLQLLINTVPQKFIYRSGCQKRATYPPRCPALQGTAASHVLWVEPATCKEAPDIQLFFLVLLQPICVLQESTSSSDKRTSVDQVPTESFIRHWPHASQGLDGMTFAMGGTEERPLTNGENRKAMLRSHFPRSHQSSFWVCFFKSYLPKRVLVQ